MSVAGLTVYTEVSTVPPEREARINLGKDQQQETLNSRDSRANLNKRPPAQKTKALDSNLSLYPIFGNAEVGLIGNLVYFHGP